MNANLSPGENKPALYLAIKLTRVPDLVAGWVEDRFERILDIIARAGLRGPSLKFFIIYAHDNNAFLDYPADSAIVKKFIAWFKRLLLDVDSDRSPHGNVPGRGVQIPGASNDILTNQLCLLPGEWDERNASQVVVFGSKLLEKYMQDEQDWKSDDGKTYTEKILDTCQELSRTYGGPNGVKKDEELSKVAYDKILNAQTVLMPKMGAIFHHVLTELAFLDFRMKRQATPSVIPILLSGDHQTSFPRCITSVPTKLRVENVDPCDLYQSFFKVLLMFENHEKDRAFIESMRGCFLKCKEMAEKEPPMTQAQYDSRCEQIVVGILRKLVDSPEYNKLERQVTIDETRKILRLHSLLDRSSIQRISGDDLPEEMRDIDLIEKSKSQQESQRLIALNDLFSERKTKNGTIIPKRIIIWGLPGVGKSTLSRRITFAYSWHEKHLNKHDLVIRVPLRRLEQTSDLKQLLFNEFFQLEPHGLKFAAALANWILDNQYKILFILDGLDETQGWSDQKHNVLKALIDQPIAIITSRFNVGTLAMNPVDLELEALGLSMKSISAYLGTTKIIAAEDGESVSRVIENNQMIQEMVRIPIYLDILCYSWDEISRQGQYSSLGRANDRAQPPTTTDFFQVITHKLWRKDIPTLDISDHGVRLTGEIVDAVRDPQRLLRRVVQAEIDLLGIIATTLLDHGRFEFKDTDIDAAIKELEANGRLLPLSLERNLSKLSFLRRDSNSAQQQNYRFGHINFQEFFATQYLVRDRGSLEKHMRLHKYNRHYEIVWRFVAGLLPSEHVGFVDFFDLLDQEPRDLIGIRHVYLTMNCLRECSSRLDKMQQCRIHAALTSWLDLERQMYLYPIIVNDTAFPEEIIRNKVDQELLRGNYISHWVPRRWTLSGEYITWLVSYAEQGKFPNAPMAFGESIHRQSSLSARTGERLLDLLERPDYRMYEFAKSVLVSSYKLHEATVTKMIGILDSPDMSKKVCPSSRIPLQNIYSDILKQQKQLSRPREIYTETVKTLQSTIAKTKDSLDRLQIVSGFLHHLELHKYFIPWLTTLRNTLEDVSVNESYRLDAAYAVQYISPSLQGCQRSVAQLLSADSSLLRYTAVDILRDQKILRGDEVKSALESAFVRYPWETYPWVLAMALNGRLSMTQDNPLDWLISQSSSIPRTEFPELPNIDKTVASRYLLTDPSLDDSSMPHSVANWLLELISNSEDIYRPSGLGLILQKATLEPKTVSKLIEMLGTMPKIDIVQALQGRPEAHDGVIDVLIHTEDWEVANNAAVALMSPGSDQIGRLPDEKTIETLYSLLTRLGSRHRSHRLVVELLLFQPMLSPKILKDLVEFAGKLGCYSLRSYGYGPMRSHYRTIEEFCLYVESFDNPNTITQFLQIIFLPQTHAEAKPAWIDGDSLWWYSADGSKRKCKLQNEERFRMVFRQGQKDAGVPEWAQISLKVGGVLKTA
ncbi:hypothetical protein F4820DRAFT_471725 [Hypoxylon rubiginosum]|uniref:Uncharacterized protein n=1 Tax=Hypoxylon rubiginosum TaxID=110542 RepID=A0ACB9YV97_9PEZI|nr:hypothetical protein F4820DRAFT_471725 [Hypoxylon rubiginosum]